MIHLLSAQEKYAVLSLPTLLCMIGLKNCNFRSHRKGKKNRLLQDAGSVMLLPEGVFLFLYEFPVEF